MTTGIPTKTRALLRMESLDPEGILLLSRVFLFFANPKNLPRKMPPWLGAGILRWGRTSPGTAQLTGAASAIGARFAFLGTCPSVLFGGALSVASNCRVSVESPLRSISRIRYRDPGVDIEDSIS